MSRCGCSSGKCSCVLSSSPSVSVSGNGTPDSPYQMAIEGGLPVLTVDGISPDGSGNISLGDEYDWKTSVTPEQFADITHLTDQSQMDAALAYLQGNGGGVVRLKAGKTYTYSASLTPLDIVSPNVRYVIEARGAVINQTGGANSYGGKFFQSSTPGNTRGVLVVGGEWNATGGGNFWLCQDANNVVFFQCSGSTPAGVWHHLSNVIAWTERNQLIDFTDRGCQEVMRFTVNGSAFQSFSRTRCTGLFLQGGVYGGMIGMGAGAAGTPKINIVDNAITIGGATTTATPHVYDSTFRDVKGNVLDGTVVLGLTGYMSGTKVGGGFSVECPQRKDNMTTSTTVNPTIVLDPSIKATDLGRAITATANIPAGCYVGTVTPGVSFILSSSATSTVAVPAIGTGLLSTNLEPQAAYFRIGSNMVTLPDLEGMPSVGSGSNRMLMYTANPGDPPPFAQAWLPNGVTVEGAIVDTKIIKTVPGGGGAVTFDMSQGSFFVLSLLGNCTALTLSGPPAAPYVPFPDSDHTASVSQRATLVVKQDATGGRTVAYPANINWGQQGQPADTTANSVTAIPLVWDNGVNKWIALGWAIHGGSSGSGVPPHAATHAAGGSDPVTLTQAQITGLTAALTAKADLVSGAVPRAQLPNISGSFWQQVANQAAMLALTAPDADTMMVVFRTDTPGYIWFLNPGLNPTVLGNWQNVQEDAAGAAAAAQAAAQAFATAAVGVETTRATAAEALLLPISTAILGWAIAQTYILVSATRDSNEAITTATIQWPDGTGGTFTTDTASTAFPGAIDAYHVTYGSPTVIHTYTQNAVTRDSAGAVTAQPALVVT